jgi:co-chaperonin GroES (HSP10)
MSFCAHCAKEFDRQFRPFAVCYCKEPVCSERCAGLHEDYHMRARDDGQQKRKRPPGWASLLSDIQCDLDELELLGNMLLVKRIPEDAKVNGVDVPQNLRTPSAEGKAITAVAARRGVVVKLGRGDRLLYFCCPTCISTVRWSSAGDPSPKCGHCGGLMTPFEDHRGFAEKRDSFDVCLGDVVFYPRVPANDVKINGEEYTILREHQHVLAVLEAA